MRATTILYLIIGLCTGYSLPGKALTKKEIYTDTVYISMGEAEKLFLEKNLLLLAQKFNIGQKEAFVRQAKVWDNPKLTISEVNLVQPQVHKLEGEGLPGRNQQLAFEIEQIIRTAGKRSKLVQLEKLSTEMSTYVFDDLLRTLKFELRTNYFDLHYKRELISVYEGQIKTIEGSLQALNTHFSKGNIALKEKLRLQAMLYQIKGQRSELLDEIFDLHKGLKLLLRTEPEVLVLTHEDGLGISKNTIENIPIKDLMLEAAVERSDVKIVQKELHYNMTNYNLQKAMAVPDLNLIAGYDRGGNFYRDFFGVGVAIDLPIMNRNKGNIKAAKFGIEESQAIHQHKQNEVQQEVLTAYLKLQEKVEMASDIDPEFSGSYEKMMHSLTKSFEMRNISLVEYIDYMDAYKEAKESTLNISLEVKKAFEELNLSIGKDIEL